MKNGHLAERISVLKIQAVATQLRKHPKQTDAKIAQTVGGITRRSVNTVRRIAIDTPQHFRHVLSGELSLQGAVKLRRSMQTTVAAKPKAKAKTSTAESKFLLIKNLYENDRAEFNRFMQLLTEMLYPTKATKK